MSRTALPIAALVAIGLVMVPAGADAQLTLQRPSPRTTTNTTTSTPMIAPMPGVTATAQIGTRLTVAELRWPNGQMVQLFAVLGDAIGRPVSGATVNLAVAPSFHCSDTTDAYGRVFCDFHVPQMADLSYPVTAAYAGEGSFTGSSGNGAVRVTNFGGGVQPPGAPTVTMTSVRTSLGTPTRLRAAVTDGGAPVAGRRVLFSANGRGLRTATTDSAGIAAATWTPTISQMDRFTRAGTGGHENYITGVQAWVVPGSAQLPSASVAQGLVFPAVPCRGFDGTSASGIPLRCSATTTSVSNFAQVAQPAFVVRRGRFGAADSVSPGRYTWTAPVPSVSPNPDCNPSYVSDPTACRRTCERMSYRPHSRAGIMVSLGNSGGHSGCGWRYEGVVTPERADFERAHDACALAAAQRGISQWNHTVEIQVPIQVTAHFMFRDPHTRLVSGSWRYDLVMQSVLHEMRPTIAMRATCR